MAKNVAVTNEDVVEIIRSYQEELDLSHDDVARLCRNHATLTEIATATTEHLEDAGISEISFGKYDKEMDSIVNVIASFLNY